MMSHPSFLIVGAGFSGATLARCLAESLDCSILVIDERPHVAGNCHTERDPATGVMVHKYGPHIFNTDNERVWKFVNQHGEFMPFVNRVKAINRHGVFSLPINLHTINQFFGTTLSPDEAREFIASKGEKSIKNPANFEEQALKFLGKELCDAFFRGYTIKQWGCDPKELPASILKRLPVRFNYDDNYYHKRFQGIPRNGYTEVVKSILDHPNITVQLNKSFSISARQNFSFSGSQNLSISDFSHLFYTGPIDAFFDYRHGRLGYRTVNFERIDTDLEDYQGTAVINYTEENVPHTRIHEHKHFAPWECHQKTVAFKEYSKETEPSDVPYYPKRLTSDKELLAKYRQLAEEFQVSNFSSQLSSFKAKVSFLGRLATYRYMDMEAVIGEALDFAEKFIEAFNADTPRPVFPNSET